MRARGVNSRGQPVFGAASLERSRAGRALLVVLREAKNERFKSMKGSFNPLLWGDEEGH